MKPDVALIVCFFFFFNDTATTEIYTLSLHDALPIFAPPFSAPSTNHTAMMIPRPSADRKSTRLNSSHQIISYAVFCLKKKHNTNALPHQPFLLTHYHDQNARHSHT